MKAIECKNCGGALRLPDKGDIFVCLHCGSFLELEKKSNKFKSSSIKEKKLKNERLEVLISNLKDMVSEYQAEIFNLGVGLQDSNFETMWETDEKEEEMKKVGIFGKKNKEKKEELSSQISSLQSKLPADTKKSILSMEEEYKKIDQIEANIVELKAKLLGVTKTDSSKYRIIEKETEKEITDFYLENPKVVAMMKDYQSKAMIPDSAKTVMMFATMTRDGRKQLLERAKEL